jgi:hypothetical protein
LDDKGAIIIIIKGDGEDDNNISDPSILLLFYIFIFPSSLGEIPRISLLQPATCKSATVTATKLTRRTIPAGLLQNQHN